MSIGMCSTCMSVDMHCRPFVLCCFTVITCRDKRCVASSCVHHPPAHACFLCQATTLWPASARIDNDTTCISTCSNSTRDPHITWPIKSEGHRSAVVDGYMYVFGGYSCVAYGEQVRHRMTCSAIHVYLLDMLRVAVMRSCLIPSHDMHPIDSLRHRLLSEYDVYSGAQDRHVDCDASTEEECNGRCV